jgi:hypothetical protein
MASRLSAAAAAALLACLSTAGAAAPAISKAVPQAKLALMPLPLAAFGSDTTTLKLDTDESGVIDNAEEADTTTDKNDSAASLKAAGRITGFSVSFADYGLFGTPGKLAFASSEVQLYRTARQASAGIVRELNDAAADDPGGGLVVLSSSRFAAAGLGSHARGVRVAMKLGSAKAWFTGVIFQRRELTVSLGLVRTDDRDERAFALRLAHAASARVTGVLAGRITTPPAKLPAEKPSNHVAKPAVPIAVGALSSADLHGAKVTRQEYVRDSSAVAAYERAFEDVTYGKSRLLSVESDVTLYGTASEAALFLESMSSTFDPTKSTFRKFLMDAFAQGAGFKLTSFSVLHRRSFTVSATKATEIVLRLGTPFGKLDAAYVFMAEGKLAGSLIVLSTPSSSIRIADLARLDRAFAKRLQAQAKRLGYVA